MCDGKPAPRQKKERHSSRLRGERRSRGAARTPQSRRRGATKRNAPPRLLQACAPPPARPRLRRLPQPAAPGTLTPAWTRRPHQKAPRGGRAGRRVTPRVKLHTAAPCLGNEAPNRTEARGYLTRPGKFPPARAWVERTQTPRASERASGRGHLFISEVTTARPWRSSEADRPREGVPATLAAPLPYPRGAPRRSLHAALGTCTLQAQRRAGDRARGAPQEGGRPDRAPGCTSPCSCLAPGSAAPLRDARAPPNTGCSRRRGKSAPRMPLGPHPPPTSSGGSCQHPENEDGCGAAPGAPAPSRGGQTGCPQHPDFRPAAASSPRPQP